MSVILTYLHRFYTCILTSIDSPCSHQWQNQLLLIKLITTKLSINNLILKLYNVVSRFWSQLWIIIHVNYIHIFFILLVVTCLRICIHVLYEGLGITCSLIYLFASSSFENYIYAAVISFTKCNLFSSTLHVHNKS